MTFKKNKKYLLHRFLVSHIFIVLIALTGKLHFEDIPIVWLVTVIIPNILLLLVKNLSSIELESDYIQLVFNKRFFKESVESYKYDDLLFTYKKELEGKSWGTRFRIYKKGNEKSVVSVEALVDGFYDDDIKMIIIELEKRGIIVMT